MTPAGTSNELDVQNGWEENTHTHTSLPSSRLRIHIAMQVQQSRQPMVEFYSYPFLLSVMTLSWKNRDRQKNYSLFHVYCTRRLFPPLNGQHTLQSRTRTVVKKPEPLTSARRKPRLAIMSEGESKSLGESARQRKKEKKVAHLFEKRRRAEEIRIPPGHGLLQALVGLLSVILCFLCL